MDTGKIIGGHVYVQHLAWWPIFQYLKPYLNNHTVSDSGDENATRLWGKLLQSEMWNHNVRAREMVQQWRRLAALQEDSGSLPSTHTEARNGLWLQFQGIQNPLLNSTGTWHWSGTQTYMQVYSYNKNKEKNMVVITEIIGTLPKLVNLVWKIY